MVDLFIDLVALFLLFLKKNIYFFPFSLFVSVYVYASLCDFVCKALLSPFVLGFCLYLFLNIIFSVCYYWWICFMVWWLSSFFLSFFLLLFNFLNF